MQDWLLRQWQDIRGNFKFWLLGVIALGAMTAALAITRGLLLWQQVLVDGTFLLLFAWAVVATARRGRPRYLITPENIEINVRNWLDATEVNVRRLPADANIHFGF